MYKRYLQNKPDYRLQQVRLQLTFYRNYRLQSVALGQMQQPDKLQLMLY
jgi:hypothetical protein